MGGHLFLTQELVALPLHHRLTGDGLEEDHVEFRCAAQPVRGDHVVGGRGVVELGVGSPGDLDREAVPETGEPVLLGGQ
jgi:hypothetical protein